MQKSVKLYDDGIGSVDYVQHMGDDLTVVNAARVSFGAHRDELDERDKKLIKYLVEHRHTSTMEHNVVTLRFTVPLFVRAQHHRHRTWSFNEISRRYTDENFRFYSPKEFRTQHKSNRQASNAEDLIDPGIDQFDFCHDANTNGPVNRRLKASEAVEAHNRLSLQLYNKLLQSGVCREQARGVLPQNMYTEYYGTIDLHNLIRFIELRSHEGAQWEIQRVAGACLEIAAELWPEVLKNFR
jgi:thymidylate synthase (FAD)